MTADASRRPGRILCVTSNYPRWEGDSTTPFVLHLAQDLRALGWQVDVLAPHAPGTARSEVLSGVPVERFRYLWPESQETVCYHGGALINLRKRPSNFLKLPALVLAEWAAVARRLASRRYDLLHSHWILPQGFTGVLSARTARVPHVLTAHGSDVFALRGRALRAFKRYALEHADAVTVNSSATAREVQAIAPRVQDLSQIPMGVRVDGVPRDAQAVKAIRARYRRHNGPLLLFVGRVVREKGVEDLLEAARLLAPRLTALTVLVVGEGQDRPDMERAAERVGLADRVSFIGWVQPDELGAYYAAADVFVAPTRGIEGQGLTGLESMAAGTPVVATRVGGIPDVVREGETGLLVSARAPDQLAAAVERLTTAPDLAARLAQTGAELVRSRFSRGASAQAFSDLFSALLTHPRDIRSRRTVPIAFEAPARYPKDDA